MIVSESFLHIDPTFYGGIPAPEFYAQLSVIRNYYPLLFFFIFQKYVTWGFSFYQSMEKIDNCNQSQQWSNKKKTKSLPENLNIRKMSIIEVEKFW